MQYAVDRSDRSPSTLPLYSSLFAGDFESALSHARAAIYAVEEDTVFEGPSLEMTKAGEAFGDYLQVMEFKDGPEVSNPNSIVTNPNRRYTLIDQSLP